MTNIYSSDKPVVNKENDSFQRFIFSKRIADTIKSRENTEGLVIGLYGNWGEGKSSALNFIENELNSESIIIVRFNPWSFSYEDNLLTNFYHTLAKSLEKNLSTLKEKIGKIFEGYGSIAGFGGADLSKFGEALSKVDPNILKERINAFIKESGKKLVIVIDDIDRLDKTEIFSLIKLVKVNADFFNTYYLLSFDNEMVAHAISERFGDGTKKSGEHFLEKIVQVPLRIPKAQKSDLRAFSLSQIQNVINSIKIELTDSEIQDFLRFYDSSILSKISTPRAALRYANSISFSIPLLFGEVNIVDLILLEGIKVFYPDLYEFIQVKSNYFLDSYNSRYGAEVNREDIKKKFLEDIRTKANITVEDESNVLSLLTFLFPRLQELLHNSFNMQFAETVNKERKVGSDFFFRRYFSYCVLKGEISEIDFDIFLESLQKFDEKEIVGRLQKFSNDTPISTLLSKVRSIESALGKENALKIAHALSVIGGTLPPDDINPFSRMFSNSKLQISYIIKRIVEKWAKPEAFDFYKDLIRENQDYDFSFELVRSLHSKEEDQRLISEEERISLIEIIRHKMFEKSGDAPIFYTFKEHLGIVLSNWNKQNSAELEEYLKKHINNLSSLKEFIRAVSPTISSSNRDEPYKASINKDSYDWITTFVDKDFIYDLIKKYNSEIEVFDKAFDDDFDVPSDDQRLRQFEHWYLTAQDVG